MYPIQYDAEYIRRPDRLSTFFRWIAVIPWLIVGVFYAIAVFVTVIISWFALLILGRYPDGLYDFNAGVLRYFVRVNSFASLVTDQWPSFGIGEDESYSVRIAIAPRAAHQSRLKVLFRLILALPLWLVAYAVSTILEAAALLAWLTIVFRGYQPNWVHQALAFTNAWIARVGGYHLLLTDAYPPVGNDPLEQSPEAIDPEALREAGIERPQPPEGGSFPPPQPPGGSQPPQSGA